MMMLENILNKNDDTQNHWSSYVLRYSHPEVMWMWNLLMMLKIIAQAWRRLRTLVRKSVVVLCTSHPLGCESCPLGAVLLTTLQRYVHS